MDVETDAVPSPARSAPDSQSESGARSKEEQGSGIPTPSKQAESGPDPGPSPKLNGSSSTHRDRPSVHTHSRGYAEDQPPKSMKGNVINISNASNIFLGQVNHFSMSANGKPRKDKISKKHGNKPSMKFKVFQSSTKTVDKSDLVIVSECLDMKGLENLSEALGIAEVELNKMKDNFGTKGVQEVAFRTLELWTEASQKCENQSAMLNILCDKLSLIYGNGGEKALRGLYKRHFPNGH